MITIRIAEEERQLDAADKQWINQQINRRRADGKTVCVRVTIRRGGLDMVLATPTCTSSGGGRRGPNTQESEVFNLWGQRGLNEADFTGGNLVAFLKQLECFF